MQEDAMRETTSEDRRNELRTLLERIQHHPERDWSEELKRVTVLKHMLSHDKDESNQPALH
jgi:hypothetical protein